MPTDIQTAAAEPTEAPTAVSEPTEAPADGSKPTEGITAVSEPTVEPTETPTVALTPTDIPTVTAEPTEAPTAGPEPTEPVTAVPEPTKAPAVTPVPTTAPTNAPTPTSGPKDKTDKAGLACPSVNGALQVIGSQLCDASGDPVQLRGVSTHGLAWFPAYVNQALFTEMREDWNANIVRLAMYTDEYGGYCSGGDKSKLKKLVKDG
ncbi:MAG: cellulase family glycosylhydrolase, partial [Lachnospiraceae bacterium]|nr:cellulase family glycosylhydrolase [Lachnospiraceae bacterium]